MVLGMLLWLLFNTFAEATNNEQLPSLPIGQYNFQDIKCKVPGNTTKSVKVVHLKIYIVLFFFLSAKRKMHVKFDHVVFFAVVSNN